MAIRAEDANLRYDSVRPPTRGHAFQKLLDESGLTVDVLDWSGKHSFETEEEYHSLVFHDQQAADKDFDPVTGFYKHKRTFAEISQTYNMPTWAEIEAEFAEYLAEYDLYAGKRGRRYPVLGEQLDMLYHDIESGLLGEPAKTSSFYTKLKTIKDANQ